MAVQTVSIQPGLHLWIIQYDKWIDCRNGLVSFAYILYNLKIVSLGYPILFSVHAYQTIDSVFKKPLALRYLSYTRNLQNTLLEASFNSRIFFLEILYTWNHSMT